MWPINLSTILGQDISNFKLLDNDKMPIDLLTQCPIAWLHECINE